MSTINPRGQTESSPLMNPVRASLVDVVARLDEGKVTSQDLVTMYLGVYSRLHHGDMARRS